jgi:hypothetical protein
MGEPNADDRALPAAYPGADAVLRARVAEVFENRC